MAEIREELVSVIRERVIETTGSRVVGECLMALADRGAFTHRELPTVAQQLVERYPDLSEIVGRTIDTFARAVGMDDEEGGLDDR